MGLDPVRPADVDGLLAFLDASDLTLSGLDSPAVRLWIDRGPDGQIVGSTGYELSDSGRDALIRSVAVDPACRARGTGTRLAAFALDRAREDGAARAWLFSRRSGPFWQKLGFETANRDELAAALATTEQVRLFASTGQLSREVAWSRSLAPASAARTTGPPQP